MNLHGTVNHLAISVSNLDEAMVFFTPFLEALGYTVSKPMPYNDTFLSVNVNEANGTAINIWQSKKEHNFDVYEPGFHHVAFNAGSKNAVDEVGKLVEKAGATILDGPAEFPFSHQGYYAVYFLGPDNIKIEVVHMPGLEESISKGNASAA